MKLPPISNHGYAFHHVILLFLFVCLTYSSIAQTSRQKSIYQDTTTVMEGDITIKTISLRGKKVEVIREKNGKKEGAQEKYNRKGTLSEKASYHDGNPDGEFLTFDYYGNFYEKKYYKYSKSKEHSLLQGKYEKYRNKNLQISANYKDSLLDGQYKEFNNDRLKIEANYKAGLLTGEKKTYSRGGNISARENYKIFSDDGKKKSELNGKASYYDNQGNLVMEGKYIKGKKEGLWKNYYRGLGGIQNKTNYKDGHPNGAFVIYQRNGNLKSRGTQLSSEGKYPRRIYNGKFEKFNINGDISLLSYYDMGKRDGRYLTYYDNGNQKESGYYHQNMKKGQWLYYDADGDTISLINYNIIPKDTLEISVKNGVEKRWKNKVLISQQFWVNDTLNGPSLNYFPDGNIASKYNYVDGLLDGEYITYYDNGNIKTSGNKIIYRYSSGYKKSILMGWAYYYDRNGSLISKGYNDSLGIKRASIAYNNNSISSLEYPGIIKINYFPDGKVMSLNTGDSYNSYFYQSFYRNGNTRIIGFQNPENNLINHIVFSNEGKILYTNSNAHRNPDSLLPGTQIVDKITLVVGRKFMPNTFVTDSIRNGKYTLLYANGKVMCELEFKKDVPYGDFVFYDPISGDTCSFFTFKDTRIGYYIDKFAGKYVKKRGKISSSGKKIWEEKYFDKGILNEKIIYDKNEKEIQKWQYYDNGKLQSVNDRLVGSSTNYYRDGNISSQTVILDSLRIYRNYFPNTHQLRTVKYYLNKRKDSIWETYFESGQLWYRIRYKNDSVQGKYIQYKKDGSPKFVGEYKDNVRVGKWLFYGDNKVDTATYKNGKVIVKIPKTKCGCVDTTKTKIGFASSLGRQLEYIEFKHFLPEFIKSIDSSDYSHLFVYRSWSDRGSYSFDLIMFDEFSINIPADEQIKITMNPCKTHGFISQMPISAFIDYKSPNKSVSVSPHRISIEFLKGPLQSADPNIKNFKALFDIKSINYRSGEKLEFNFAKDTNPCFSVGIIKDFLKIEVISAKPLLFKKPGYCSLKLNKSELNHFFGLEIHEALLSFDYQLNNKSFKIESTSDFILAGGHFAAGRVEIKCKQISSDEYQYSQEGVKFTFSAQQLKSQWNGKGFSRMETSYSKEKQILFISFFVK